MVVDLDVEARGSVETSLDHIGLDLSAFRLLGGLPGSLGSLAHVRGDGVAARLEGRGEGAEEGAAAGLFGRLEGVAARLVLVVAGLVLLEAGLFLIAELLVVDRERSADGAEGEGAGRHAGGLVGEGGNGVVGNGGVVEGCCVNSA